MLSAVTAPAGSGTSAHAADLAEAFSWFPCWTQLNPSSHSQDWNSDGRTLRTFLSLWYWGSALVAIQPSCSGYHPIFLTMDGFHRCGITLSAIQRGLWWRGVALAFSHYRACEHRVCGAAHHETAWELVRKACALAQDRWHTGKWELGRNSSDGWYIHLFPSTE